MNQTRIQHLIVLMLENRSFDHMLGYLEYPDGTEFEGIRGKETSYGNPLADGSITMPDRSAGYFIDPGPGHSHEEVMRQLLGKNPLAHPYAMTNTGFASEYETLSHGNASAALQCFAPDKLPVLATLARQFAVCDHWFCSVPGATWPNRNFAHAATSDGEVNIVLREYHNKTIFEQLSAAQRDWAVYYGGFPAQAMAFVNTWDGNPRGQNWLQRYKPMQNLYRAIQYDRLPHYAFVEPDMLGRTTNSQHPSLGGEENFKAGEQLIWRLYMTLRENLKVFEKTLLLITYDEHGGFFDHFPPPQGSEWSVPQVYHQPDSDYTFPFDLLGVRVPAVLVSPWIAPGTIDHTIYDHASIPATARKIARVEVAPLTPRDARANTFDSVLNLDAPRADLPEISEPFVDETLRRPFETIELRESITYILRDLIWTRIAAHPLKYTRRIAQRSGLGMGMIGQIILPNLVQDIILTDIAPAFSPKAQEKINQFVSSQAAQEFTGEGANTSSESIGPVLSYQPQAAGLPLVLAGIQERISDFLADQGLVDEAMLFADRVLRRLFEGHHILLRTTAGVSLQDPDNKAVQEELAALYNNADHQAHLWLADHLDRWLVVHSDGLITFSDQRPAGDYWMENASVDTARQFVRLFSQGKIARLRDGFIKKGGILSHAHEAQRHA